MDYKELYKSESYGPNFNIGVEIRIAAPFGESEEIDRAARVAGELLGEAILREFYANDPETQERALAERVDLINCFAERPIFVRAIPNGYCNRACHAHKPWFQVTTPLGMFVIGWRERVIVIDWSDTLIKAKAESVFAEENVTKNGSMIHAWSYEDAERYITVLFNVQRTADASVATVSEGTK